mgnify:CR=1 FL=1
MTEFGAVIKKEDRYAHINTRITWVLISVKLPCSVQLTWLELHLKHFAIRVSIVEK